MDIFQEYLCLLATLNANRQSCLAAPLPALFQTFFAKRLAQKHEATHQNGRRSSGVYGD